MKDFKKKSIYQIYPKSFYDSNHDGYGDLNGIIKKLDYFVYLGIDVIWITPFFRSPQNDNGYDVGDYYTVDERFGTMEDFENLCTQAKQRNISIMLDMVFNHTSTTHEWFQKALKGDKKYKDYYIFKKGKEHNLPPTNWVSKFGGNAWEYVEQFDEYYLHLFDKTQADLNWDNPSVRNEMADVVNFWMGKGVSCFRFDVVNLISKPDVYEDDTIGDGRRFYTDGKHVHEYLKELNNKSFGRDEHSITVGEMSSTSLQNCVKYAGANEQELSMVFSFHHLKVDYKNKQKWALMPFDFIELKTLLHDWQIGMQEADAWNALFWCNHDQPRIVSRFGNDTTYWKQSAKMLATALHMLRGTPYIYQGEELGMTNAYFNTLDEYRDVESLNYYDILKKEGRSEKEIFKVLQARSRDNSRTPMQWSNDVNAGFSSVTPWIAPIHNYETINVEQERHDNDSILEYYRKLIRLRKEYPIIADGTYEGLFENDKQIFAYKRHYNDEELIVLNNFYDTPYPIEISGISNFTILLGNYPRVSIEDTLTLHPYETIVLYKG